MAQAHAAIVSDLRHVRPQIQRDRSLLARLVLLLSSAAMALAQSVRGAAVAASEYPMRYVPTNPHSDLAIASMIAAVAVPVVAFGVMCWLKERAWYGAFYPIGGLIFLMWLCCAGIALGCRGAAAGRRARTGVREQVAPSAAAAHRLGALLAMLLEPRSTKHRSSQIKTEAEIHWRTADIISVHDLVTLLSTTS